MDGPKDLIRANNEFGLELWQKIIESEPNHTTFISPFSIATVLAMISCGANNEVCEQMRKILKHDAIGNETTVQGAFKEMMDRMKSTDKDVQLLVADGIWTKDGVKEDFIEMIEKIFSGEVKKLTSASDINVWCAEHTRGMIRHIIESIPQLCKVLLINAVFFKGSWKFKFDKSATQREDFIDSSGTTSQVLMMKQQRKDFRYGEEQGRYQLVELPYGETERYCSYVMLPCEGVSIFDLVKSFSITNWQQWMSSMMKREGTVCLPQINIAFGTHSLKKELEELGMIDVFKPSNALNRIGSDMFLSDILHKAVLEVDESGTMAAAVSVGNMRAMAFISPHIQPFCMRVNRPFIFVIADKQDGSFLFLGKIEKPI